MTTPAIITTITSITTVYRLVGMYSVSTDGADWYASQRHGRLGALASKYSVSYQQVAGMYAALSPNINWLQCYIATERVLLQRHKPDDAITNIAGYSLNVRKAIRILRGESPLRVLKGPKVTAFYHALMGREVLVVDMHIINAWRGRVDVGTVATVNETERRQLVCDYFESARLVGASIRSFQARVWNEQRRLRDMYKNWDQRVLTFRGE